jgi:predicted flap endonuclease-1-like 5' DNA nuclease
LEKDAKTWVDRLEASSTEMSQHKEKAAGLEENKKQLILELEKTRKQYEKDISLSGGEMDALNDTFEDLKERYFKANKELSSTRLEKERINYQHESFQEQVMNELELVRKENKKLNKTLLEVKTEKYSLEFSKEELLARIQALEEMGGGATPDQAKLIKVINRLKNSVNQHQEQFKQFEFEKSTYEKKIESLEQQLQAHSNSSAVQQLMEQQKKDNFKTISGLTTATAEILNDFGIYTYGDLAELSDENKDLLNQVVETSELHIDKWISEAKQLAKEA